MRADHAKLAAGRLYVKGSTRRPRYVGWTGNAVYRERDRRARAELRRNSDYNDLQRQSSHARLTHSHH
jgi:hypothetical protein